MGGGGAVFEDGVEEGLVVGDGVEALLDGFEESDNGIGNGVFEGAVLGALELGFECGDGGIGGGGKDSEEVGNARFVVGAADIGAGVGDSGANFLADDSGGIEEEKAAGLIGVRLRHFAGGILERFDAGGGFGDIDIRHFKGVGISGIELNGEVAAEFDMLFLVFADGDAIGVVEEDIGGHEDGIKQQACADEVCVAALRFILKLGHAFELAERAEAAEDPCEFIVADDVALGEQVAFGGIEAAGDVHCEGTVRGLAQFGGFIGEGDCVLIDDTEKALKVIDERTPIGDGAEKVAEVEVAGGLSAGEDSGFHGGVAGSVVGEDVLECLAVALAGLGDDIGGQARARGRFIPCDGFEKIADKLLIERGLRASGLEIGGGPKA